jgi:plasmid stabilization system protein ParE
LTVRFTPSARRQFLQAVGSIAADNRGAARASRRRAETRLRRLERFPESGRAIPEFPDLAHRELVVSPYRFFYRVQGRNVWVVAVWHGAQLPGDPAV